MPLLQSIQDLPRGIQMAAGGGLAVASGVIGTLAITSGTPSLLFLLIALLFLLLVAVIVVAALAGKRSKKKSGDLAQMLVDEARSDGPSQEAFQQASKEVAAQWEKAAGTLKEWDINLYESPWYCLLGEPGSGKTTLLSKAGLQFALGSNPIPGGRGTRNCEFLFAREATLVDTAGRFSFPQPGTTDEKEWEKFLHILSGHRSECPINGVMVTIPATSLLEDPLEERKKKGQILNQRLKQMQRTLGICFPVYVLVTKCDRILGFNPFFSKLPALKQNQILGWTNKKVLTDPVSREDVAAGLDELAGQVEGMLFNLLSDDLSMPERDAIFLFPAEFRSVHAALLDYVDEAFKKEFQEEDLFFRGVYFSSAVQQGKPIAHACASILEDVSTNRDALGRELEKAFTKSRAYFLGDLLMQKVFPEKGLVLPTRARLKRVRKLQKSLHVGLVSYVAGFSLLLVLASFFTQRENAWVLEPLRDAKAVRKDAQRTESERHRDMATELAKVPARFDDYRRRRSPGATWAIVNPFALVSGKRADRLERWETKLGEFVNDAYGELLGSLNEAVRDRLDAPDFDPWAPDILDEVHDALLGYEAWRRFERRADRSLLGLTEALEPLVEFARAGLDEAKIPPDSDVRVASIFAALVRWHELEGDRTRSDESVHERLVERWEQSFRAAALDPGPADDKPETDLQVLNRYRLFGDFAELGVPAHPAVGVPVTEQLNELFTKIDTQRGVANYETLEALMQEFDSWSREFLRAMDFLVATFGQEPVTGRPITVEAFRRQAAETRKAILAKVAEARTARDGAVEKPSLPDPTAWLERLDAAPETRLGLARAASTGEAEDTAWTLSLDPRLDVVRASIASIQGARSDEAKDWAVSTTRSDLFPVDALAWNDVNENIKGLDAIREASLEAIENENPPDTTLVRSPEELRNPVGAPNLDQLEYAVDIAFSFIRRERAVRVLARLGVDGSLAEAIPDWPYTEKTLVTDTRSRDLNDVAGWFQEGRVDAAIGFFEVLRMTAMPSSFQVQNDEFRRWERDYEEEFIARFEGLAHYYFVFDRSDEPTWAQRCGRLFGKDHLGEVGPALERVRDVAEKLPEAIQKDLSTDMKSLVRWAKTHVRDDLESALAPLQPALEALSTWRNEEEHREQVLAWRNGSDESHPLALFDPVIASFSTERYFADRLRDLRKSLVEHYRKDYSQKAAQLRDQIAAAFGTDFPLVDNRPMTRDEYRELVAALEEIETVADRLNSDTRKKVEDLRTLVDKIEEKTTFSVELEIETQDPGDWRLFERQYRAMRVFGTLQAKDLLSMPRGRFDWSPLETDPFAITFQSRGELPALVVAPDGAELIELDEDNLRLEGPFSLLHFLEEANFSNWRSRIGNGEWVRRDIDVEIDAGGSRKRITFTLRLKIDDFPLPLPFS